MWQLCLLIIRYLQRRRIWLLQHRQCRRKPIQSRFFVDLVALLDRSPETLFLTSSEAGVGRKSKSSMKAIKGAGVLSRLDNRCNEVLWFAVRLVLLISMAAAQVSGNDGKAVDINSPFVCVSWAWLAVLLYFCYTSAASIQVGNVNTAWRKLWFCVREISNDSA